MGLLIDECKLENPENGEIVASNGKRMKMVKRELKRKAFFDEWLLFDEEREEPTSLYRFRANHDNGPVSQKTLEPLVLKPLLSNPLFKKRWKNKEKEAAHGARIDSERMIGRGAARNRKNNVKEGAG